ncbi:MAG: helix-hairpin-helix domain-containing protein [Promethearchaeota archaeon]
MSVYESRLTKQQDELIRTLVKRGQIKFPVRRIFQEFAEYGISKRKIKRTIQDGRIYPVYFELSYPTGIRKRRGYVAELEFDDDSTLLVNFKLLPTGVVVIYSSEWKGMAEALPEEEFIEEELGLLEPSVEADLEAELDKIGVEEQPTKKKKKPKKVLAKEEFELTPEELELDLELDLTDLPGVGQATADKLIAAGCPSIEDLVTADLEKLSQETGISLSKLKKYVEEAKKIL